MKRSLLFILVAVFAFAIVVAQHFMKTGPQSEQSGPQGKRATAVERLRSHLARPNTLVVHDIYPMSWGDGYTVEIDFSANDPSGQTVRTRFWVQWNGELCTDEVLLNADNSPVHPHLFRE